MYKDDFHRLNETVEASEALIQRTLQAAEQRATRKQLRPWQLAGVMAAALCVLVAAVFLQRPAPHDLLASNSQLPASTASFLPLASAKADVPKVTEVSAGAATINEDGTISIPVTVEGELIQDYVGLDFSQDDSLLVRADWKDDFPEPASRNRFTFTKNYKLQEGKTLADLGESVDFTLDMITIVDVTETVHSDVLLSTLPQAEYVTGTVIATNPMLRGGGTRENIGHLVPGEPLIDLGNDCAVSAIGFNDENQLVVQLRMPAVLSWRSTCGAYTTLYSTTEWDWDRLTSWDDYVGWWSDDHAYTYWDFTFAHLSPANLGNFRLATRMEPTTAQIEGPWSLSAPLPVPETSAPPVVASQTDHLSNPVVQAFLADPFLQYALGEAMPEIADVLQPIGLQTSHSGITFEIVAACLKDGYPIILTAVSGNEVGQWTDSSFSFEPSHFSRITFPNEFDESTHTKYFLIIAKEGRQIAPGQELTIDLYGIRFDEPYEYTIHRDLDLAAHAQHRTLQYVTASRTDYETALYVTPKYTHNAVVSVMKPGDSLYAFPDGSYISAIGAINGKLRIQSCSPEDEVITFEHNGKTVTTSNGGTLSLSVMPRSAETYSLDYNALVESTFGWSADGFDYAEHVLRISAEDAADYVIRSTYRAPSRRLDGEWEITFNMP